MKKVLPHILGGLAMMSEFADQEPKKVGYSKDYNFGPDAPRSTPRERPANHDEKRKKRNKRKRRRGY